MQFNLKKLAFRKFKKLETNLHELNYLFWECTTRCNLNCLHCGSDCSQDSNNTDMPADIFLNSLDTIENPSKRFIVVISGGEPLLRKDIEYCGKKIREKGMYWSIVTNGHLYTKERHNSLLNAGMGALTISLDGLEDNHNWLRNNVNSFSLVCKAIETAARAKGLNFDVVTCINKNNISELAEIHNVLNKLGVRKWRLFTIIPIGRAINNPELHLDENDFTRLMEFISSIRKSSEMYVSFSCEGYVGSFEKKVRDTPFFCRAGINIGSVLIDGSISACPNIDRSFVQGNIYKDNLFEVWQTKFEPFRNREWTQKGKCAHCEKHIDCQGNGLHNWHGDKKEVLVCHYNKLTHN